MRNAGWAEPSRSSPSPLGFRAGWGILSGNSPEKKGIPQPAFFRFDGRDLLKRGKL
jgi:hypothetical protein